MSGITRRQAIAPEHAQAFEELVAELRATEEWKFIEREVDIRLAR